MANFVIIHGAWAGGWYLKSIAQFLRSTGHEVYTPTLTGIGERVHLGTPDTNLDTHIQDVVNVLVYEDLQDVVLVGYSYGGMVVTGVVDAIPERIKQIIYLDAMVPQDGQAVADLFPEIVAGMQEIAQQVGDGWQVPHHPPEPRKTAQPLKTLTQPITLSHTDASNVPRNYVLFTKNSLPFAPTLAEIGTRAKADGWRYREFEADHIAPETHGEALAELLLDLI